MKTIQGHCVLKHCSAFVEVVGWEMIWQLFVFINICRCFCSVLGRCMPVHLPLTSLDLLTALLDMAATDHGRVHHFTGSRRPCDRPAAP